MILTGTTPRALSRLGFLAVLGLGFLLPVVPTWGQDKDDDEKQIDKKDVIKKEMIKKLKDEALKQVDIDRIKKEVREALDKDLKIDLGDLGQINVDIDLDLQNLADELENLGDAKDGAGSKEVNRARAEIQRAQSQIQRAKAQIEHYQQVLQKAETRLAELEKSAKVMKEKSLKQEKLPEKVKRDAHYENLIDKSKRNYDKEKSRSTGSKDDDCNGASRR